MPRKTEILSPEQLKKLTATFPLISRLSRNHPAHSRLYEREDIVQEVKLGLLIWKSKRPQMDLTTNEWLRIANRATQNEIKNFYRRKTPEQLSLAEISGENVCPFAKESPLITQPEGNTKMELKLLVTKMWEKIQTQSFFENCALLLKNDELVSSLIYYRGCRIKELAIRLNLTEEELEAIIEKLPLSDQDIANYLSERFELKATPAAIRKARQRATDQLRSAVSGKPKKKKKKQSDGKTSGHGKT